MRIQRNALADRLQVLSTAPPLAHRYDGGAHGLFSNSSTVNPSFHNWTKVYVRYCDGGSFSGDALATAPDGKTLHLRGRRILDAVLDALVER